MRKTNFVERLGQDLRYAARMLVKSPASRWSWYRPWRSVSVRRARL